MRNIKRRRHRKLPPKKRPERKWCPGGENWLTRHLAQFTKKVNEYLANPGIRLKHEKGIAMRLAARTYVRCPECNRRLHPRVEFMSSDEEFRYAQLPRHMAK